VGASVDAKNEQIAQQVGLPGWVNSVAILWQFEIQELMTGKTFEGCFVGYHYDARGNNLNLGTHTHFCFAV
jgi:hypothetical protein